MKKQFKAIASDDILSKVDIEKIKGLYTSGLTNQSKTIDTCDFLLSQLDISREQIKDVDLYMRNYIYAMTTIQKDLKEIYKRLDDISKEITNKDNSKYKSRKLNYFKELNHKACEDIIEFLTNGLNKFLASKKTDMINSGNRESKLEFSPSYDYHYNSDFYDASYDFSTWVKFYNAPDVNWLDRIKTIESYIKLKKEDEAAYNEAIIDIVDRNKLVSNMAGRVGNNYHLRARKEIFETMDKLFCEHKYLSFVTLAVIQVEGVFDDLVSIKYGKNEQQGTLVEKVNKTFNENQVLKRLLYPYFAFEVPELRNSVAHKGIVSDDNLKQLAYNLVLDLYYVFSLTEQTSIDKFAVFLMIGEELNKIDSKAFTSDEEYKMAIARKLLEELYANSMFRYVYFWEMLFNPDEYSEEIDYYKVSIEQGAYLRECIYSISGICRSKEFWQVILTECKSLGSGYYEDFLQLISNLRDNLIGKLDPEVKPLCVEVSKIIGELNQQNKSDPNEQ